MGKENQKISIIWLTAPPPFCSNGLKSMGGRCITCQPYRIYKDGASVCTAVWVLVTAKFDDDWSECLHDLRQRRWCMLTRMGHPFVRQFGCGSCTDPSTMGGCRSSYGLYIGNLGDGKFWWWWTEILVCRIRRMALPVPVCHTGAVYDGIWRASRVRWLVME